MSIISKEEEIQENLASVYDILLNHKETIKIELISVREYFDEVCDKHIASGFTSENNWIGAKQQHKSKFIEYEIYCQIFEVINDFKDHHGHFPEYHEMYQTLYHIMIQFANNEKYELAAIIKLWVDKINKAIYV